MPLKDIDVKSAIDELYTKYSGNRTDYITLRTELETINKMILNQAANVYYDSSDMTYAAVNRKDKELAGIEKSFEKDRLYGIVLYTLESLSRYVYIDVPGKTPPILDPDVFYTDPNLQLSKYKEYLFEADSSDYLSIPVVGGIATVKVPYNFPEHIYTNAEDAVFVSMKRPDILVSINDAAQPVRQPLTGFGGLAAVNGPQQSADTTASPFIESVLPDEPAITDFKGELASFVDRKYILQAYNECKVEHPRLTRLSERFPKFVKESRDIFKVSFTEATLTKQDIKYINEAASYYGGFDPDILLTIGAIETKWGNYLKTSPAGARGIFQVMPIAMYDLRLNRLKKAQGWLKKLIGVNDKASNGVTIPVLDTIKIVSGKNAIELLLINEKFTINYPHVLNLNLPKYREASTYYSADSISVALEHVKKAGYKDDLFLMSSSYNGGWGKGLEQLNKRNYANISGWNLNGFNEENHKYMMKFYIVYSLIKCAKKAAKAAESSATPVS